MLEPDTTDWISVLIFASNVVTMILNCEAYPKVSYSEVMVSVFALLIELRLLHALQIDRVITLLREHNRSKYCTKGSLQCLHSVDTSAV